MAETAGSIVDEPVRGHVPDAGFLSLTGIERLRALADGRVPASPVQHLTGLRVVQAGHGSCTVTMPASPWFQTQAGFFLSGVSALAADFALGGAIGSALPAWTFPVTSDINFTYLRPPRVDANKIIARGRLIDAGRSQGTSEAIIEDGDGRVLAHATTRCFIRNVEPQDAVFRQQEGSRYDAPDPFERPLPPDTTVPSSLQDLAGIDVLRLIAGGSLPAPFMRLTGHRLGPTIDPGLVTNTYPATPWFTSPSGAIYGGLLCFVADGLTTAAATSLLDAGTATASLDLKVHFLRPALADGGLLTGRGEVVHGGKGLIVARSEVRNGEDKPLVVATGSFMRRRIRDWVPVQVTTG